MHASENKDKNNMQRYLRENMKDRKYDDLEGEIRQFKSDIQDRKSVV